MYHFCNVSETFLKCYKFLKLSKKLQKMDVMKPHSFALTELLKNGSNENTYSCVNWNVSQMHQKCFISACPWMNPIPMCGHTCPWVQPHPREPKWVLHGYILHFVPGKFSRTKVCDPLAERAFKFPNIVSFETKSKTGTKMFWKHFKNVSFMTVCQWCVTYLL